MSKSNLHALVKMFFDRHQVLGDRRHMQDISHNSSLTDMAQRDILDMLDGVRGVITSFDDPWFSSHTSIHVLVFSFPKNEETCLRFVCFSVGCRGVSTLGF